MDKGGIGRGWGGRNERTIRPQSSKLFDLLKTACRFLVQSVYGNGIGIL